MKVTRLYAGTDGESHFGDIEIPLEVNRGDSQWSEPIKATGVIFLATQGDKQINWHNAPGRQFVITLEGRSEIVIGDGTRRLCEPGDIFLAEDTMGRGHMIHPVNNEPQKVVFVTLE